MRTLIPTPISAAARPAGRFGRWLGFALTSRSLLLFLAGLLGLIPAFFHLHRVWLMVAWDALVLALVLFDALTLPPPSTLTLTRTFLDSPRLGERTRVELSLLNESNRILAVSLTDALDASLAPSPEMRTIAAFPRDPPHDHRSTSSPTAAAITPSAMSLCVTGALFT